MTEPSIVHLSQDDVREALVEYAAKKAALSGILRHHVTIHGVWTTIGDGPAVSVVLELVAAAPTTVGNA